MFIFVNPGGTVEIETEFNYVQPTGPVEYDFVSHPSLNFEAEDLSPVTLSNLANGLYFLRISIPTEEGLLVDEGKFAVLEGLPNTPRNEYLILALTDNIDMISLEAAQDAYSLLDLQ